VTVLRLERRAPGRCEPALAAVDEVSLIRSADGTFAELAADVAPLLVRALAFVGVAATPCASLPGPRADLHPAIGRDLSPLQRGSVALDIVRIRRIPLPIATRDLMRREWLGLRPPSRAARDRCRALLRGADTAILWIRTAWATAGALRAPTIRAALRPAVFERPTAQTPRNVTYASDGLLERWLF
jgi:hypothetical protein